MALRELFAAQLVHHTFSMCRPPHPLVHELESYCAPRLPLAGRQWRTGGPDF